MTIARLTSQAAAQLNSRSDSPVLDAEVLLAYVLDLDRATLLRHYHGHVDTEVERFYERFVRARRRGIPVAYLTGRQAWRNFELTVSPHTLIPRPFTETLVDATLERFNRDQPIVIDVGTGSGAIALAIAHEANPAHVIATDISQPALAVAALNARRYLGSSNIEFRHGSLLEPIKPADRGTVLIANLPYLPAPALRERSLKYEPRSALFGGDDGLTLLIELFRQLRYLPTIRMVVLELLPEQADTVGYLLRRQKFSVDSVTDGQAIRGLIGQK